MEIAFGRTGTIERIPQSGEEVKGWESLTNGIEVEAAWRGYLLLLYWGLLLGDWENEQDCPQWQGSEGLGERGTIGLLLDLHEGTLSVFKNGSRLGVTKDGLGGEYVWFVSVYRDCTISMCKGRAPN